MIAGALIRSIFLKTLQCTAYISLHRDLAQPYDFIRIVIQSFLQPVLDKPGKGYGIKMSYKDFMFFGNIQIRGIFVNDREYDIIDSVVKEFP